MRDAHTAHLRPMRDAHTVFESRYFESITLPSKSRHFENPNAKAPPQTKKTSGEIPRFYRSYKHDDIAMFVNALH